MQHPSVPPVCAALLLHPPRRALCHLLQQRTHDAQITGICHDNPARNKLQMLHQVDFVRATTIGHTIFHSNQPQLAAIHLLGQLSRQRPPTMTAGADLEDRVSTEKTYGQEDLKT